MGGGGQVQKRSESVGVEERSGSVGVEAGYSLQERSGSVVVEVGYRSGRGRSGSGTEAVGVVGL